MRGKQFIGLVLTERQAKSLLSYAKMLAAHGAGRTVAKDLHAIVVKLDRALRRVSTSSKVEESK